MKTSSITIKNAKGNPLIFFPVSEAQKAQWFYERVKAKYPETTIEYPVDTKKELSTIESSQEQTKDV